MAHARGVYRELDGPRGEVIFKVFNCVGRRISRNEVPEDLADDAMFEAVEAWLDRQCPPGHTCPCPSAESDIRPVVGVRRMVALSRDDADESPFQPRRLLRLESSA